MAVVVSSSLVKVKLENAKEDLQLHRRLDELERGQAETNASRHKEKCELVSQLRANRSKEIRGMVRERLMLEEKIKRQKLKLLQLQNKGRSQVDRSRGFSKITIDQDDPDDMDKWRDIRSKQNAQWRKKKKIPSIQGERAGRKEGVGDEEELEDKEKRQEQGLVEQPLLDSDVVIYYPLSATGKRVPPVDRSDYRSFIQPLDYHNEVKSKLDIGTLPKLKGHDKLPSYVPMLSKLREETFDEYTDGSMALAMRRFRQRQMEKMPQQTGHLPVRSRYGPSAPPLPDLTKETVMDSIAPTDDAYHILQQLGDVRGRAFTVRPDTTLQFYIPKSVKDSLATDDVKAENDRLDRLQRAEQSQSYKSVLKRNRTFFQETGSAHMEDMVNDQPLTREETLMLETIQERKTFASKQNIGIAQVTKLAADGKLKRLPQPSRPPVQRKHGASMQRARSLLTLPTHTYGT